ncbi:hypothetical protein PHMEG_00041380 [Phytophthora megakarya]|uniref:FYVE zinc finger domain-containing protein n=1 Tax=Phytophthora megakarya TaxID=4795 RepID=A0A225UBJ0_9STRA|nr:hypothetical protein PHMEG_00041380 [Phytophthora megakarya]
MDEVLNILVSQKSSDYEATMKSLSGKRFERGAVLYQERCRLFPYPDACGYEALLGAQTVTLRPSWKLRLTPRHLCPSEHPSKRLCFASLTYRRPGTDSAVHLVKTLPRRICDQITPGGYCSVFRHDGNHLGISFDVAAKTNRYGATQTTIFVHAYVAGPRLDSSMASLQSKHGVKLFTQQLREFDGVIRRRRFGYLSLQQNPLNRWPDQICIKRFSLFRRELHCQICGSLVRSACLLLYEVEHRNGEVRKERVCRDCVSRVNSCTFAELPFDLLGGL